MYYDLHTHTVCSDGQLTPERLVAAAAEAGVRVLAVTDHDTVAAIADARRAADRCGVVLVAGVEISVSWAGNTVHIVGLDMNPADAILQRGLAQLQAVRRERAVAIVARLAAAGIEGAAALLAREGVISRVHIADWLVAQGHAPDSALAFRKFLSPGRPGYVAASWASLADAVGWVVGAGGRAVLAHPTRYRLSAGRLRQLVSAFTEAGGGALEVVSAGLDIGESGRLARLAAHAGLLASVGSDFHKALPWRRHPGGLRELPVGVAGVWTGRPQMQPQGV